MEIQRLRLGVLRRPGRVLPPYICARLEDIGFGQLRIAIAFEILLEKREENIAAVIVASVGSKLHPSQMIAVVPAPSTVHPGADHQAVENPRIVLVDGVERREGALQILGIEPSPDREHGAMDVLHVRREVARLPIIVVSVVVELVVPESAPALQILCEISDRACVQIELVSIFGAVIEGRGSFRRELRILLRFE